MGTSLYKLDCKGLGTPVFSVVPKLGCITQKNPSSLKLHLEVRAVKRPEISKKDLRQKKPRDFDKSKTPLSLELPAPLQSFERLDQEHLQQLHHDQAIGQIVSAQANFMRVIVFIPGGGVQASTGMEKSRKHSDVEIGNQTLLPTSIHQVGLHSHGSEGDASVQEENLVSETKASNSEGKVGMELLCVVRALLKKIKKKVMVGDKVLVSGVDWVDGRGMIEQVFDRDSEIPDPPVANVNQLLLLFSLSQPRPEPWSLSRFLVEAESTGIPFSVVFNKIDLVSPKEASEWENKLISWGYKPLRCSATTRMGISSLVEILASRTSVIIGSSGVGKSSVINALCDEVGVKFWNRTMEDNGMVQNWSPSFEEQAVGEVSERSGRGKHTTRNVSLLKLPGNAYLADTPGFNQPALAKVSTKSLPLLFPEIRERVSRAPCAFADCSHTGEPNCSVGGDWERYVHYLDLLEELRKREQLQMRVFGTKRESEVRYKVGASGIKQLEPRLVLKKHRRVSRQKQKQELAVELADEAGGFSGSRGEED